mmetsp:Transcript_3183/g.5107  ORF Transcript_3183/g.5107 Transcript_3183/m.5107 type:complete len:84 (-) Transcript_3183:71-322(-)
MDVTSDFKSCPSFSIQESVAHLDDWTSHRASSPFCVDAAAATPRGTSVIVRRSDRTSGAMVAWRNAWWWDTMVLIQIKRLMPM